MNTVTYRVISCSVERFHGLAILSVAGAGADLKQSTEHFIGRESLHSRYELGEARSCQQTAACSTGRPPFSTVTGHFSSPRHANVGLSMQLMRHVRLPLMARDFLMSYVDSEALVRENAECKELLLEAMRYHLLPEQRSALTTERTVERRPEGMRPYLFAVGTCDTRYEDACAVPYARAALSIKTCVRRQWHPWYSYRTVGCTVNNTNVEAVRTSGV